MNFWRCLGGRFSRATTINGVFFVFIAVIVVVIACSSACGEAIQHEARYFGLGFAKKVDAALDGFARSFSGPDDKDRFVSMRSHDEGIAYRVDWRAVDNDAVIALEELREKLGDVSGAEKFCRVWRTASGRDE